MSKGNDKYHNNRFKKRKVRRIMEKMFLRDEDHDETKSQSDEPELLGEDALDFLDLFG